MKHCLLLCSLLTALVLTCYGQANTKLSNLVAPTAVNQHILPNSSNARDLGSSSYSWRNLYLRGDVYLDGTRFLSNAPGTASFNVFVGSYSGISITRGINNTAIGYNALSKDTSGSDNIALGTNALFNNTSGVVNVAIGNRALRDNKTGFYNIAIGQQSLAYNNGSGNIAMGVAALPYLTTGRYNVGIGGNALMNTTTAEYNTAVGSLAANSYVMGYNNVFVGAYTDVSGPDYYNVIVIGQGTIGTASSQVTMGNSATRSYRAYASWSNISDGRFKQSVHEGVPGLSFINKLRPVTYRLNAKALDAFLNSSQSKDDTISVAARAVMDRALQEKETLLQTGFVAQEVATAAKEAGFAFSGVEVPQNDNDVYALRYSEFVVPLVKAVQELSKENEELKRKVEKVDALEKQMAELKALLTNNGNSNLSMIVSSANIEQNVPNPARSTTTIRYHIPEGTASARLALTNSKGQLLKTISIHSRGAGQVNLDTSSFPAGVYNYTLWVAGREVDTKQLVITR